MENAQKILNKNEIKPTFERLSILNYLESHSNHPTAGLIYNAMQKKIPTISKTTVYNTLKILKEHGIIHSVNVPGGKIHYDVNTNIHYHFFCTKCKKIYNLKRDCPQFKNETIEGHKIDNFHGYFTGICKNCRSKNSK